MPSQRNQAKLQQLKDHFSQAKSVAFTTYSGLSVNEQTELRANIVKAGGKFTVAKNTLLKLASGQNFDGPTAILFSFEDEIAPLKTLKEFIDQNNKIEVKSGRLNDEIISAEKILQLANLPSKNQLLAQLGAQIISPLSSLRSVLAGNLQKLTIALNQIQQQKGGES